MAKKHDIQTIPLPIGNKYFTYVTGAKASLLYLLKGGLESYKSDGKENIFPNMSSKGIETSATGDSQSKQTIKTETTQKVANRRIILPTDKIVTEQKNGKTITKYTNYYIVFPRGINLILVADALYRSLDFKKIRFVRGKFLFRLAGGGWHPIFEVPDDLIKTILKQEGEAKKKRTLRSSTAKTIEGNEPT